MNQRRIAFIITGLGTGGAEHMLCKLIEVSRIESTQTMVISLLDEGAFGERMRAAGAKVVCCHLNQPRGLLKLFKAYWVLKAFRPTILQGWMYHGNFIASLFGRLLPGKISVFWSMRQTLYSLATEPFRLRIIIRLLAVMSHRIKGVIYNSSLSLQQHQRVGLVSPHDMMLPNGFDLERYRPDAACRQKTRVQLDLRDDAPLIGLVARVHPMKDHANFIAAAGLLSQALPKVRFLLAGEGTASDEIKNLLQAAGIVERTLCLGRIEHTEELYPALDLLVLSSSYGEGWPNVLGEAMACGVVCVATDIGESRYIVGDTGAIVPPQNPQALANACEELLRRERSVLHNLGKQARERVFENFDIHAIFRKHVAIWDGADAPFKLGT